MQDKSSRGSPGGPSPAPGPFPSESPTPQPPRVFFPDGQPSEGQPPWRRTFPVDVPRDRAVSRRDFTRLMVLTGLACTVGQFGVGLASLKPAPEAPAPRALTRVDGLPVGGTLRFAYPGEQDPNLLMHLAPGIFVAYGQRCTHLECPVVPRPDLGRLECPCHQGWFDMAEGRPQAGPPRRPLPRVLLEIRDGVVYATGVQERPI